MDNLMMSVMKELEGKSRGTQRIYVEVKLEAELVAESLSKKVARPSRRREMVEPAVK